MASIKRINERKFKITISNGYRADGRKISKAKTITIPDTVPRKQIEQYVLFSELPPGDMSAQGSFTEVYLSVGRPLAFKEALVKFVADDIHRVTGWPACKANVLIHDLQHGSVAAGGKILNRSGTAAEAAMKGGAK